jgi:hypothetical protein
MGTDPRHQVIVRADVWEDFPSTMLRDGAPLSGA